MEDPSRLRPGPGGTGRFGTVAHEAQPRRAVLSAEHVCKHYGRQVGLADASVTLYAGELVAIIGGNGQGKSTLLRILALDHAPTLGRVVIFGRDVAQLKGRALDDVKSAYLHYIPQGHLGNMPLTARETVAYFLKRLDGLSPEDADARANAALAEVGLTAERYRHRRVDRGFSGGEKARVAMATAIARNRPILLADEILAAVDPDSSGSLLGLFRQLAGRGLAVALIVHQPDLLGHFDRVITINDKHVTEDRTNPRPVRSLSVAWPPAGNDPPAAGRSRARPLAILLVVAVLAVIFGWRYTHGAVPPAVPLAATHVAAAAPPTPRPAPTLPAAAPPPATQPPVTAPPLTAPPLTTAAATADQPGLTTLSNQPQPQPQQRPLPMQATAPAAGDQPTQPGGEAPIVPGGPPPTAGQTPAADESGDIERDPSAWAGGFYRDNSGWCGRPWVAVYGALSKYPAATLDIPLTSAPANGATLTLTGMDDEAPGNTAIRITVNGETIFDGPSPFPSWDGEGDCDNPVWTPVQLTIPPGVLQAGVNTIAVANLEPSATFSAPPYVMLSDTALTFGP